MNLPAEELLVIDTVITLQLFVLAEGQVVYSGLPGELNKFFKDASDDPTFPDIQIGIYHFC